MTDIKRIRELLEKHDPTQWTLYSQDYLSEYQDDFNELRNEIGPLLDRVERWKALEKQVRDLIFEAEEYDFPDGMGKMALQQYWDDLQGALDAIDDAEDDATLRGKGE